MSAGSEALRPRLARAYAPQITRKASSSNPSSVVRRRRPSALTAAWWADGDPLTAALPGSLVSVTPAGRAAPAA